MFKGKIELCNTDLDVFPVSGGKKHTWKKGHVFIRKARLHVARDVIHIAVLMTGRGESQ